LCSGEGSPQRARESLHAQKCYKKVLQMVEELEARLEEYEYEEALKSYVYNSRGV
jgi:hypothetical protein